LVRSYSRSFLSRLQ